MGYKIGELFWKIEADTTDFDKGAKKTETTAKGMGKSLTAVGKVVTAGFTVAIVAGIGKISKELINAASEAEETRNKFNVVFGDVEIAAESAATNLTENFGLSRTAAQGLLSDTGDLLTGFGFTGAAALDLSSQVNELAVDLASFTNFSGGAEGASQALTKALLGERESVKALGISILDADVKAKVLELTQQGMIFETERQAKAQATLAIAIEQSGNAIGDFERSSDSYANQTRIAKAAVDDLKVAIGENLLPAATATITTFGNVTRALADFVTEANKLRVAEKALANDSATANDKLVIANKKLLDLKAALARADVTGYGISKRAREQLLGQIEDAETVITNLKLQIQYSAKVAEEVEASNDLINESNEAQASLDADLASAEEERLAEAARLKEERYQEELEQIRDIVAEKQAAAAEIANIEALTEQASLDRLDRMTELAIREREIRRGSFEYQKQVAYDSVSLAMSTFNATSAILALYADDNKKAAIAAKAFSLAEAAVNTGLAFTKTLVDGGPFPLNAINAAAVLTAGTAQIIQIAATPIPSFETGGIVPGTSYTGDNVTANVNSREGIFTLAQQKQLFDIANGGGSGGNQTINIQLDKKTIATAVVSAVNAGQGGVISQRVVK